MEKNYVAYTPGEILPNQKPLAKVPFKKKLSAFCAKTRTWLSKISVGKISMALAKIFMSAMLWSALGYFVPELRQAAPSFFSITDMLVGWLDALFGLFCSLFNI